MAHIGTFEHTSDGYFGRLRTLTLDTDLAIVPAAPSDIKNAPDFRVLIGKNAKNPAIGAGWQRKSERVGDYLTLVIDDPTFARSIRARLVKHDDKGSVYHLRWNRASQSKERT